MSNPFYKAPLAPLDAFEIGQTVIARFTNSNRVVEFVGRIIGKTKNYWKVESIEDGVQGWPAGRMFHVATLGSRIYSNNNRIVRLSTLEVR